jgi:hypothetical protein
MIALFSVVDPEFFDGTGPKILYKPAKKYKFYINGVNIKFFLNYRYAIISHARILQIGTGSSEKQYGYYLE